MYMPQDERSVEMSNARYSNSQYSNAQQFSSQQSSSQHLGETYRQLEGFPGWNSVTVVDRNTLTLAEVQNETPHKSSNDAFSRDAASDSWVDMLVTLALVLFLVVSSSVTLGFAASRVTILTQQLTQRIDHLNNASSWNF